jgi:hypothetical protein
MKRGCEAMKEKRRAGRNPNCIKCEAPLVFNDSGPIMDTTTICDACQLKTKQATDAAYRVKLGHRPAGSRAEIVRRAAQRRAHPITQKLLKELFHFSPDTGVFTRLSTGQPAGKVNGRGYVEIKIFRRPYVAHGLALLYMSGKKSRRILHLNGDRSDNRYCNLRDASGVKCETQWPHYSSEYVSWKKMKARTSDKKHPSYKYYGALGVTVCAEWKRCYANFLRDMGRKPTPQHTIDRIDPYLGYYKDNCRWATRKEQAQNKRRHHGHWWVDQQADDISLRK